MNNNYEKVAIILIDGLRSDAALQSENPFFRDLGRLLSGSSSPRSGRTNREQNHV
ncbi:hypothetical protein FACS1894142_4190 [Spirochaetia bacterium]|nr:hypothetical protein FACS1894142_4190 [Spirochaetia bacterium]